MFKWIKKIPQFLREVKDELQKVNWSTRHELVMAGVIVVIASTVVTVYIFAVDIGLSRLIQVILK